MGRLMYPVSGKRDAVYALEGPDKGLRFRFFGWKQAHGNGNAGIVVEADIPVQLHVERQCLAAAQNRMIAWNLEIFDLVANTAAGLAMLAVAGVTPAQPLQQRMASVARHHVGLQTP
jgi:hypothetical protein